MATDALYGTGIYGDSLYGIISSRGTELTRMYITTKNPEIKNITNADPYITKISSGIPEFRRSNPYGYN